jgi:hypothetical protein
MAVTHLLYRDDGERAQERQRGRGQVPDVVVLAGADGEQDGAEERRG